MNPARSLAPAVVAGRLPEGFGVAAYVAVYLLGPALGALFAVGAAYVFRGPGGDAAVALKRRHPAPDSNP